MISNSFEGYFGRNNLYSSDGYSGMVFPKMIRLVGAQRQKFLAKVTCNNWTLNKNKISKDFEFRDFQTCFTFMTLIAFKAEKLDHHPEWYNCYNKLSITLTTHDCDDLSTKDEELSDFIESSFNKHK
jgi:pterin-4a-carbinolamine dehydratase